MMKKNDDLLKKVLHENIQKIDDEFFTKRIVENHLAKKQINKGRPFINFMSLIIGLSFVLISIVFVFLLKQNNKWINDLNLNVNHGLILFALSIIFLINKWLEEFTTKKMR